MIVTKLISQNYPWNQTLKNYPQKQALKKTYARGKTLKLDVNVIARNILVFSVLFFLPRHLYYRWWYSVFNGRPPWRKESRRAYNSPGNFPGIVATLVWNPITGERANESGMATHAGGRGASDVITLKPPRAHLRLRCTTRVPHGDPFRHPRVRAHQTPLRTPFP